MDQAKGVVWDVCSGGSRERCWIYGVNWLWMFNLAQDMVQRDGLSSPPQDRLLVNGEGGVVLNGDDANSAHPLTKTETTSALSKRKRARGEDGNDQITHGTTGAGGPIHMSQLSIGLGRKIQRIEGAGEADGEATKRIVNMDANAAPQRRNRADDGNMDIDVDDGYHLEESVGEEDEDVEGNDSKSDESDADMAADVSSRACELTTKERGRKRRRKRERRDYSYHL